MIKKISFINSRKKFFNNNKNFIYMCKQRFDWMKKYINDKKIVIEIGSGNGLIKNIISKKIITSDIKKNKWIDKKLDMNNFKLDKKYMNNVDVFIFNHSLHHSKQPILMLKKTLKKYLKKNGYILINEPYTSPIFKFFLIFCNHERWDDHLKNTNNFWEENNSTSKILFENKKVGEKFLDIYKIIKLKNKEFLIFLNSSGSTVSSFYIPLPFFILKIINFVDKFLIFLFPNFFSLTKKIVLKKIK